VLVVDDERLVRESLCRTLRSGGCEAIEADGAHEVFDTLSARPVDLVLLDLWLSTSPQSGMEVLEKVRERYPQIPVVMISGRGSVQAAVEATKIGAHDFLEKGIGRERILLTVRNTLENARLHRENERLLDEVTEPHRMVGSSAALREVQRLAALAAQTESRVLIAGESGVGKELVARAIHRQSARAAGPFLVLDCGTLAPDLIESELFGHEEGAYTGAKGSRRGRFEQADGGTLFLDEVGNMGLNAQARFLRLLGAGEVTPLGAEGARKVDVRLITAYNRNLMEAVAAGTFREDLYYRLAVFPIYVPSLRERSEDIPFLVEHTLKRLARTQGRPSTVFTDEALALMVGHDWPGNVRELENVVERLVVLSGGTPVTARDVAAVFEREHKTPAPKARPGPALSVPDLPLDDAKRRYERRYLVQALVAHGGNQTETAAALAIDRSTLHRKVKEHAIEVPKRRGEAGSDDTGA
jgi:two-component system nitrogen regulation response regulator NtrX